MIALLAVGAPDLLAKEIFSEEIPRIFGDALAWRTGVELGVAQLHLDGLLTVKAPFDLSTLPAPWSLLRDPYVVVEVKMPGDHTTQHALQRALLRRQALVVVLLEQEPAIDLPVTLWLVAPHLPAWLSKAYRLQAVGEGCYRFESGMMTVLWVAANELPLHEALLPLLVARNGRKRLELLRWGIQHRAAAWVTRMLERMSMSPEQVRLMEAELKAYNLKAETAEEKEAARGAARLALLIAPEVGDELREQGKAEGLAAGKAEGLATGKAEGVREAVEDLCELLAISLTDERRAHMARLDLAGLELLRQHLKRLRSWPPATS